MGVDELYQGKKDKFLTVVCIRIPMRFDKASERKIFAPCIHQHLMTSSCVAATRKRNRFCSQSVKSCEKILTIHRRTRYGPIALPRTHEVHALVGDRS